MRCTLPPFGRDVLPKGSSDVSCPFSWRIHRVGVCGSRCRGKTLSPVSGARLVFLAAGGCCCSRAQLLSSPLAFCVLLHHASEIKDAAVCDPSSFSLSRLCLRESFPRHSAFQKHLNNPAETHSFFCQHLRRAFVQVLNVECRTLRPAPGRENTES